MIKKILKRVIEQTTNNKLEAKAILWAESKTFLNTNDFIKILDLELYEESLEFVKILESESKKKLSSINVSLGGGGNYLLLYFLIRKFKPNIVVETGVAAGWSTLAILRALNKNQNGKLFSTDFPLFRLDDPEKHIGLLVKDEKNISDWTLDIRGDEIGLPFILSKIGDKNIDLFHYDSDKSYSGRKKALDLIQNKLSKKGIIIFDDIQNNFHFRDLVLKQNLKYQIFEFNGKYVGLIGIF